MICGKRFAHRLYLEFSSNVIAGRHGLVAVFCSFAIMFAGCGNGRDIPTDITAGEVSIVGNAFATQASTQRFLGRATFGATQEELNTLSGSDVSDWIVAEFDKPPTLILPKMIAEYRALPEGKYNLKRRRTSDLFIENAILADDQLRQRMVLALSEILVVSNQGSLTRNTLAMGHYVDTLSENAFGNFRDILTDLSYSPAMATWLTYLNNDKGDPETGRVPDENYARELLQLFSIGLNELNLDGTLKLDRHGNPVETYTNDDIIGLARVFTGMSFDVDKYNRPMRYDYTASYRDLKFFPEHHSRLEKTFLGTTIPPDTDGEKSLEIAIDTIFNHPNVAPFISKQLIQRFVTSNPEPAYVRRVAGAFEAGSYTLPDGRKIGTGQRGDMKATIAAILLDRDALQSADSTPENFGKVREPILRFLHWARTFSDGKPVAGSEMMLKLKSASTAIGQQIFNSPTVFNFFGPNYSKPGTLTSDMGLSAPELQIINDVTVVQYINFINAFIYDRSPLVKELRKFPERKHEGINANYAQQIALADDAQALIAHLDILLTGGQLDDATKAHIQELMKELPIRPQTRDEDRLLRVRVVISMIMTDPAYLVQR